MMNAYNMLEAEIPGDRWNDWKKRHLSGINLQRAIIWTARLIKINKVWIQAAIEIVNTENPAIRPSTGLLLNGRIGG